ncbi:4Fe-4S dicluster domain-containing protein [Proteiniclasticum ruminis]|uniref:Na+-translocating ferredoxin:NAD+ oxidoreductase RNF, RnfC subunit n=1 Tax=Proteiniclasticum ruminis TaxID=398199 RepID=A0A1G8KG35_9CLOT|nr:4Fe-4S dicluster domain-containing protein [Proteiniclasticum ruminis]SDI42423.1 Na+-translocating ferredoxin:NAD+ oxidoreductase RNF, RnfC subunit [Proteiniclasticum ruminis]
MSFLENIYLAGVIGEGGAGFPAHIKYAASPKYLLINGAECEPLLYTDKFQMENYYKEMLAAIQAAKVFLKAERAVLATKKRYEDLIGLFQQEIKDKNYDIEIFSMENFYPAGDEQITIYEAFQKAVPAGGIPLHVDIVVSNIATMKSIYDAQNGIPVTDKYLTVTGEVREPKVLKVPVGMTLSEVIERAGGSTLKEYMILTGGPMMGKFVTQEEAKDVVVRKTTGGILIVPKHHALVQRGTKSLTAIKNETRAACIQCSFCTQYCPRYLIGHPLHPHKIMRAFGIHDVYDERFAEALLCCECGICELFACPMNISPRIVNVFLKQELRKNGIRMSFETGPVQPERENRYVPVDRLLSRLDIRKYYDLGKPTYMEIETDQVRIPLGQYIGKPAVPCVKVGDFVEKGALIGDLPMTDLGSRVHASITGRVTAVDDAITIVRERRENA